MLKVAVFVLADITSFEDLGRLVNALETVKELKDAGDEVQLIFDGAGTKWIGEVSKPEHNYSRLFDAVKDKITGVCSYCAHAYGVVETVKGCRIVLLDEYEGHPSIRNLLAEGYQIITF